MKRIHLFVVTLAVMLVGSWSSSQSTLGNMFKLGSSTTANLPTNDAGLLIGALIYDLDAGAPKYNDGTTWQSFGSGSSSGGYWLDGGAGTMYTDTPIARPFDGGWALRMYNLSGGQDALEFYPSGITSGAYATLLSTAQTYSGSLNTGVLNVQGNGMRVLSPGFAGASTTGFGAGRKTLMVQNNSRGGIFNIQLGAGLSVSSGTAGDLSLGTEYGALFYGLTYQGDGYSGFVLQSFQNVPLSFAASSGANPNGTRQLQLNSSGVLTSYQSASNVAFAVDTTGAQLDLGAGSSDYCASDGIGLETPSYWESTIAYPASGVISQVVQATGVSSASMTSVPATGGQITYDTTAGTLMLRRTPSIADTTSDYGPVAPHPIFDEQTFTTRIMGLETNSPPTFAETVTQSFGSGTTLRMYWTDNDNITQLQNGRAWYYIETPGVSANTEVHGYSAASTGTALQRMVSSETSPSFCQRIKLGTSITNTRMWFGLVASEPTTATSTMNGPGAMFRLDSSVAANRLDACTNDGVTTTCKTALAVLSNEVHTICFQVSANRTATFFVDGAYVTESSVGAVGATPALGAVNYIEQLSTASRLVYIGPMVIGSK